MENEPVAVLEPGLRRGMVINGVNSVVKYQTAPHVMDHPWIKHGVIAKTAECSPCNSFHKSGLRRLHHNLILLGVCCRVKT